MMAFKQTVLNGLRRQKFETNSCVQDITLEKPTSIEDRDIILMVTHLR